MKDKKAGVNRSRNVHGYSKCRHLWLNTTTNTTQMFLLVERELYLCGFRFHLFRLLSIKLLFFSLKGKKKKGSISQQLTL